MSPQPSRLAFQCGPRIRNSLVCPLGRAPLPHTPLSQGYLQRSYGGVTPIGQKKNQKSAQSTSTVVRTGHRSWKIDRWCYYFSIAPRQTPSARKLGWLSWGGSGTITVPLTVFEGSVLIMELTWMPPFRHPLPSPRIVSLVCRKDRDAVSFVSPRWGGSNRKEGPRHCGRGRARAGRGPWRIIGAGSGWVKLDRTGNRDGSGWCSVSISPTKRTEFPECYT